MITGKLASSVFALALFAFSASAIPSTASAQTATDLKCKGCVGKKDLGKKAVKSKHIKTGAVDSRSIKDNSVAPDDLAAAAKPTGVEFTESTAVTGIPDTLTSLVSATVTAPTSGFVVIMASWFFYATDVAAGATCYLTTQADTAEGPHTIGNADGLASYHENAAMIRTVPVEAGDTTVHLNCIDAGSNMNYGRPNITALFVPNRY